MIIKKTTTTTSDISSRAFTEPRRKKRKCALTEKISFGYAKHYLDVFRHE